MPNPSPTSISLKIRITHQEGVAFGSGMATLLEAIDQCRSIAAAGRSLGLSYTKTRHLVDEMNESFQHPLIESAKGGAQGGGTQLTEVGRKVLTTFRIMEAQAKASLQEGFQAIRAELATGPRDR